MVKVVGTRFTVTGMPGSNITVDHGVVEVTCDGGRTPPSQMASRTVVRRSRPDSGHQRRPCCLGKDAETVNAAIGRGLQYAADAPVRGELLARRIQLHLREDDLQRLPPWPSSTSTKALSAEAELQPLAALKIRRRDRVCFTAACSDRSAGLGPGSRVSERPAVD